MYNFILPDKLGSDSRTYQVNSIPTIDKTVQLNFEPQVGYSFNLHIYFPFYAYAIIML